MSVGKREGLPGIRSFPLLSLPLSFPPFLPLSISLFLFPVWLVCQLMCCLVGVRMNETNGVGVSEAYSLKGEDSYTNGHSCPMERHAVKVQGM